MSRRVEPSAPGCSGSAFYITTRRESWKQGCALQSWWCRTPHYLSVLARLERPLFQRSQGRGMTDLLWRKKRHGFYFSTIARHAFGDTLLLQVKCRGRSPHPSLPVHCPACTAVFSGVSDGHHFPEVLDKSHALSRLYEVDGIPGITSTFCCANHDPFWVSWLSSSF